jgi:hypothetical protein
MPSGNAASLPTSAHTSALPSAGVAMVTNAAGITASAMTIAMLEVQDRTLRLII